MVCVHAHLNSCVRTECGCMRCFFPQSGITPREDCSRLCSAGRTRHIGSVSATTSAACRTPPFGPARGGLAENRQVRIMLMFSERVGAFSGQTEQRLPPPGPS